ncbi:MAG: phytanoyl-CoA dioxygenase family protein, partial [Chlamydiales bacterium]|nr:phytanoyl-CoA dioxygenase family protein [Chlamydiales bacterium]
EAKVLYNRLWYEFIEQAWPACKLDDRSNWKEAFPIHNKVGLFSGPAGQTQVMWDVRQDPRVVAVFEKVWNTGDLIVSMDGLSLMCPIEIREGYIKPWPHVDQSAENSRTANKSAMVPPGFVSESLLKTKPFTIQGQFLFEESQESDGGFYCIPKSHLRFEEFAPVLEAITAEQMTNTDGWMARIAYLNEFFSSYPKKHVTAPAGSIILWDSRTVHWNQHASADRPKSEIPKVRMVGYICYVPKSRLTDEGKAIRKLAFDTKTTTTHNPAYPSLVPSKDGQTRPEYEEYLEDKNFVLPDVVLTPLGKSLLGF